MITDFPTLISKQVQLSSGLYLVATPIGNLKDITLRALETLLSVDIIACEDTRVTSKLLSAYNIQVPKISYHDHNASRRIPEFIEKIKSGVRIALVSDAGMPLISDPGFKLVQACQKEKIYVTSIPGANAALTALQLSGLPSDSFTFGGFLPSKSLARKKALGQYKANSGTVIFYETALRLPKMLADVKNILGNCKVAVVREITKRFEEVISGSIGDVLEKVNKIKGEVVVVIGLPDEEKKSFSEVELKNMLIDMMETLSVKDAVLAIALETGLSKREIYAHAIALQQK